MGVGLEGREGGVKAGVFRCIIGGRWSSSQWEKCHQKLESIPPSIFVERKSELLYVELMSTSLSLAQRVIIFSP